MNSDLLIQGLAVVIGASGALSWVYLRYRDIAKKYPLLCDALKDFLGVAQTYYLAKADGTYSTGDQIAMGQATIEFINALEAIGIKTGISPRIMQIAPLIPSDATIKVIQDQIDQTIVATSDGGPAITREG